MRKSGILDPLISRPVQQILSAVLLERVEPWYLSDLAKRLRRTPSTLQRPLDALVSAGILRRYAEGNRVYFAKDPQCPILSELESLLVKTVGLIDVIRVALNTVAQKISVAFVYGSVARGEERSPSDVDLLIVGTLTLSELSPLLNKAERKLGRPVNATVLQPQKFVEKVANRNHFLRSVLARERIFVRGTAHDLDNLASTRKSRTARNKQGGT